jgi:phenylacetate-coenzyme A ligase PaaK-like adenylate-forming protein
MLSGYPSNLALLANFDELKIKPDVVITGGELLTDEIRQLLINKFNCYVQTHYSCTEAGEIACECSEKHLHINEDWVIVEPVDKNNNPVDFGAMSDKVLITNLSNFIQPFIRYELNDRVIVHNEKCKCGKTSHWIEVEGRTDDILQFNNNIQIAPMSFYKILEEIKEITRFQLIQKSINKLELRIISNNKEIAFKKAKTELIKFLSSKNLNDITIELSANPPEAHKISGKFNHIYKDFK